MICVTRMVLKSNKKEKKMMSTNGRYKSATQQCLMLKYCLAQNFNHHGSEGINFLILKLRAPASDPMHISRLSLYVEEPQNQAWV